MDPPAGSRFNAKSLAWPNLFAAKNLAEMLKNRLLSRDSLKSPKIEKSISRIVERSLIREAQLKIFLEE
jgi:hypothetical protein